MISSLHEVFKGIPDEQREGYSLVQPEPQGLEFWESECSYYLIRLKMLREIAAEYPYEADPAWDVYECAKVLKHCRAKRDEFEEEHTWEEM